MNWAISTELLSRRFGRLEAVHDLALSVRPGSFYALLGPNGAGKTTTIHMLMNLLEPSAGRASVLARDCRHLGPTELARIGYVSENQQLPGWMTVEELLAFCRPLYPSWDADLCAGLVRRFGLPMRSRIRSLSRGMRLKTAMAASLAYRPALLVLDEPFSGLDVAVREELVQGTLELAGQSEWTLFVSSHDLEDIENLVDQIGFINHGRLSFSEDLDTLRSRFREVEITLPAPAGIPPEWPPDWLFPRASGSVIRFIASRYREGESEARIRQMFPQPADLSVSPLSLRSIFVALSRADASFAGKEN